MAAQKTQLETIAWPLSRVGELLEIDNVNNIVRVLSSEYRIVELGTDEVTRWKTKRFRGVSITDKSCICA